MNKTISVVATLLGAVAVFGAKTNWYTESFFFFHEDHHTFGNQEVGGTENILDTENLRSTLLHGAILKKCRRQKSGMIRNYYLDFSRKLQNKWCCSNGTLIR